MHSPDLLKMQYNKNMPEIFNASQAQEDKIMSSPSIPTTTPEKEKEIISKKARNVDDYSEIMRREKPSSNCLQSFLPKPIKFGFDTQLNQEKVILVLRQHPITLLKKIGIIIFGIIFPLFFSQFPFTDFFPTSYQFAMIVGWYTITMGLALETFLVWFFSVYIITDERIIDVDFISLLFKDVSSAKLDDIQDISSKTGGLLATVVDYGTVYIQTAGEKTEIEFENVPQPAKVAAILNELLLEEEREKIEGRVS
ncbi:MAG: hypothetical protein AUK08_04620 [Candidatus Pacebacteria bacterium CG2_30_36_39]|nr:MAG: hypothetical protein AUK08_04620 [Candidatus Pacebacteria bacterium CG2_30_36_39]